MLSNSIYFVCLTIIQKYQLMFHNPDVIYEYGILFIHILISSSLSLSDKLLIFFLYWVFNYYSLVSFSFSRLLLVNCNITSSKNLIIFWILALSSLFCSLDMCYALHFNCQIHLRKGAIVTLPIGWSASRWSHSFMSTTCRCFVLAFITEFVKWFLILYNTWPIFAIIMEYGFHCFYSCLCFFF